MRRRTPPLEIRLDGDAERVRRNQDLRIVELAKMPAADLAIIANIRLADGVPTPINHDLGRVPKFVTISVTRGAVSSGYVNEVRDGTVDRSKQLLLEANDYGATVTVEIVVM